MARVAPWRTVRPACRYALVRVPTRRSLLLPDRYGKLGVGTDRVASPRRVGGTAMARVAPWRTVRLACRYAHVGSYAPPSALAGVVRQTG